jgi:hypothetical protein
MPAPGLIEVAPPASRAPSPAGLVRKRQSVPRGQDRFAIVTTAVAVAMLPLLVPRGPANAAPADLFIGIAVVACLSWALARRHRCRFPYALAIGLFMVGGAVGALVGPVPSEGVITLLQDTELLLWCWAVANIASSPGRLRPLMATWAYSSIAWAALLVVGLITRTHFLTGQTGAEGSRTALTFFDPNYSANYYFISIMIIWASGVPRHRGFRLAAYLMLVVALVTTGSNSGVVALIVGVAVAATLGAHQRRGAVAAVAALAFLTLGAYLLVSNVSLSTIQEKAHASRYAVIRDGIGRSGASVTARSTILDETVVLYRTGSPLGEGPVSTKTRLERTMAPYVKEAHDDYLAAVIERGVLGACGLLLLMSALMRGATPLATGRLAPGFRAVLIRPNALAGALAGTIVAEAVYELLHVRHIWTLFALVAAIYLWGRE